MDFYRIMTGLLVTIAAVLLVVLVGYHIVADMCRTTGGTVCLVVIMLALVGRCVVLAFEGKEDGNGQ